MSGGITGADVVAFVVSLNLHRRHLSTSDKSLVAGRIAKLVQGARTDLASNEAMSQAEAAALLNIGRNTVQHGAGCLQLRVILAQHDQRPAVSGALAVCRALC